MTMGITVMRWLPPPQDLIKVNTDDADTKCSWHSRGFVKACFAALKTFHLLSRHNLLLIFWRLKRLSSFNGIIYGSNVTLFVWLIFSKINQTKFIGYSSDFWILKSSIYVSIGYQSDPTNWNLIEQAKKKKGIWLNKVLGRKVSKPVQIPPVSELVSKKVAKSKSNQFVNPVQHFVIRWVEKDRLKVRQIWVQEAQNLRSTIYPI